MGTIINELEGLPPGPTAVVILVGGPGDGGLWRVPIGASQLGVGDARADDPRRIALYRRRGRDSDIFDYVGPHHLDAGEGPPPDWGAFRKEPR
jgi:hypothetical protein